MKKLLMILIGLFMSLSIQPSYAQEPIQVTISVQQQSALPGAISYQLRSDLENRDFTITGNQTYPLVMTYTHAGLYQYTIQSLQDDQSYVVRVYVKNSGDQLISEIDAENNKHQKTDAISFVYGNKDVPHENTKEVTPPSSHKTKTNKTKKTKKTKSKSENENGGNQGDKYRRGTNGQTNAESADENEKGGKHGNRYRHNQSGQPDVETADENQKNGKHHQNAQVNQSATKLSARTAGGVKTGDATPIALYAMLALAAGAVILVIYKKNF